MKYKYIVVGGMPFRGYTGTLSFTGLDVIGQANTAEEVKRIVEEKYDECGGLLLSVDARTGEVANI